MVLVVESPIAGKLFHKKLLELVITFFIRQDAVAREDSFGIGIDDKDGFFAGVEQDGICRFGADAVDGQ